MTATARVGLVSERVAQALIDHIRVNGLGPGSPVPSEIEFSARLGVSRGIVREGYRSLSMAGIIDVGNGRCPRVGHLAPQVFTYVLRHALATRQVSPLEVLDVRAPIEIRAAELAAVHRTDRQADDLVAHAAAMRRAGRRSHLFLNADIEFHEIIGRSTSNRLFGVVAGSLRESLLLSIRAGLIGRSSSALTRTVGIHQHVAEAIADRDAAAARRYMAEHFDDARVEIAKLSPELLRMIAPDQVEPVSFRPKPTLVDTRPRARAR